jgi:hypothetical protein
MATTAIWDIKGRLDKVVNYAKNPDKTDASVYSENELQGLGDVMDYTMQDRKTEKKLFVTGVNCDPETARDQMVITKLRFCKVDGILAFHAYQSFAKGETTPDTAHEIGVRLARELWGQRFEIIVATHLDKGHLHNHFVINSVSFLDGKKYNDCNASYRLLRQASDRLCKEYGLSVVENPERGRARHYAEWKAENEGHPTWRSSIREDVDQAVMTSMSFQAFIRSLKEKGYEVVTGGKYMKVRPQGKERFVRLYSLGDNYTEEAIRQRILRQRMPTRPPKLEPPTVRRVKVRGDFRLYRVTWKGLRALYIHYLYKLRMAQRQPTGQAPFLLREDLRLMDAISEQAKFLHRHGIGSAEQLTTFRADAERKIAALIAERKALYNEKRHAAVPGERGVQLRTQIGDISTQLKSLRQDIKLCDGVLERSLIIREKLEQIKQQEKEEKANEPNRRRSGTDREHGDFNGSERR